MYKVQFWKISKIMYFNKTEPGVFREFFSAGLFLTINFFSAHPSHFPLPPSLNFFFLSLNFFFFFSSFLKFFFSLLKKIFFLSLFSKFFFFLPIFFPSLPSIFLSLRFFPFFPNLFYFVWLPVNL